MRYSKEESKMIWDQNAEFWDYTMGDESNDFHRNVVRPKVTELLNPNPTDYIFKICRYLLCVFQTLSLLKSRIKPGFFGC